jgi:hypothetical protein
MEVQISSHMLVLIELANNHDSNADKETYSNATVLEDDRTP